MNLKKFSNIQLLQQQAAVIDELKMRGVVRTRNNPVGDYGEYIVAKNLKLKLAPLSEKSFDAKDARGLKYQIKARRITSEKQSRQLSTIRGLKTAGFDFLIAVIFDTDFNVIDCYKIPHGIIEKYAKFSEHVKGHNLILRGKIITDSQIEKIKFI